MVVIVKLAAELQIALAAKLRNTLADMLRLGLQIFLVVKADAIHSGIPLSEIIPVYYNVSPRK